jgi:hypothetical protein
MAASAFDADSDAQRLGNLLLRCAEFVGRVGVDGDTAVTPRIFTFVL